MSKQTKITFHVKKTLGTLALSDIRTDSSIDTLCSTLCSTYKEYELEPKAKLRAAVVEALKYIDSDDSGDKQSSGSKVLSLNQGLSERYQQSSSKRHRPQDAIESDSGSMPPQALSAKLVIGKTLKPKRSKADGAGGDNSDATDAFDPSEAILATASAKRYLADRPVQRLADLAGIESVLSEIRALVFHPISYPQLYTHLGVLPPCGLLLHGPSGCGKSHLALAIAGELGLPFYKVSAPELIGGASGESEERVRAVFEAAAQSAPSVLFIDAIDAIAMKRENTQRGMDRRVIAQLLDSIDFVSNLSNTATHDDTIGSNTNSRSNHSITDNNYTSATSSSVDKKTTPLRFVILIAATNKADSLDSGVRGRFSREIALPVPDAKARALILTLLTCSMRLDDNVLLPDLGKLTPGYVGADLKALVRESGVFAVSRIVADLESPPCQLPLNIQPEFAGRVSEKALSDLASSVSSSSVLMDIADDDTRFDRKDTEVGADESCDSSVMGAEKPKIYRESKSILSTTASLQMSDFLAAIKIVQPSAKREGFAVVPDVTWNDVGALAEVREELHSNILDPIANPEKFLSLGLDVPAGVLFFGPPGCGKTLLAKAIANHSGANFISVKGPELLNMYVGESESRVRQVFSRARMSAPCVIFFDELDALCPRRGSGFDGGNGVSERVVNQLLTELDGLETRKDVYIIAATNRLELIDDAMLRPGRLGKLLYIPLPGPEDRVSILAALTRKLKMDVSSDSDGRVDVAAVGSDPRAEGFSGADLAALVREAGLAVVRDWHQPAPRSTLKNIAYDSVDDGADTGVNTEHSSSSEQEAAAAVATSIICARHFEAAFKNVRPSVSLQDRLRYELVHKYIKEGMGAVQALKTAASKVGTRAS